MAASGWLALGPIGTGSLGLLLLGGDAPATFAAAGIPGVGDVAFGIGVIGGTVLWGYGVWWLLLAVLKMAQYARHGMPFNLGWWAFTFPLGVYTLATMALARVTHLEFFSIAGSVLALSLAGFWLVVATQNAAWGVVRLSFRGPLPYRAAAASLRFATSKRRPVNRRFTSFRCQNLLFPAGFWPFLMRRHYPACAFPKH